MARKERRECRNSTLKCRKLGNPGVEIAEVLGTYAWIPNSTNKDYEWLGTSPSEREFCITG